MLMDYSKNEPNELDKLRSEIDALKRENEDLVKNLYKVNEKLRDSERLKGHFISNITNEIVNPFTSVIALAENIRQLKDGEMSQAHRMAELIFEEAFHLDFQLKNIFAAALIEAGMDVSRYKNIQITELSDNIRKYFRAQLNKKNISLSVSFRNEIVPDFPITFNSDYEKIDLILKNLISNSLKYSPDNSVIELDFILTKGNLSMEVSDHGKGIPAEGRSLIFDRFKQLDEKINSINTGHGLGLSIVQAYAEMLGGKVSLNDNLDGGIRVVVTVAENLDADEWDDLEDFLFEPETRF